MGYIWPSKPVLYLPFDEGRGNRAYDQSEYKNDGTIYGANWVKGKFGYALEFDGVDDYVDVGDNECLQMTDEVTLMAWIKTKYDGEIRTVIARNYGFMINAPFGNKIEFFSFDGANSTRCVVDWLPDYDNKWLHVVAVIRKYTGSWTIRGFVNGELKCESTNPEFNGPGELGKVTVGSTRGVERFFNGTIDEVRIYNRALTPLEIKKLYYIGKLAKEYLG